MLSDTRRAVAEAVQESVDEDIDPFVTTIFEAIHDELSSRQLDNQKQALREKNQKITAQEFDITELNRTLAGFQTANKALHKDLDAANDREKKWKDGKVLADAKVQELKAQIEAFLHGDDTNEAGQKTLQKQIVELNTKLREQEQFLHEKTLENGRLQVNLEKARDTLNETVGLQAEGGGGVVVVGPEAEHPAETIQAHFHELKNLALNLVKTHYTNRKAKTRERWYNLLDDNGKDLLVVGIIARIIQSFCFKGIYFGFDENVEMQMNAVYNSIDVKNGAAKRARKDWFAASCQFSRYSGKDVAKRLDAKAMHLANTLYKNEELAAFLPKPQNSGKDKNTKDGTSDQEVKKAMKPLCKKAMEVARLLHSSRTDYTWIFPRRDLRLDPAHIEVVGSVSNNTQPFAECGDHFVLVFGGVFHMVGSQEHLTKSEVIIGPFRARKHPPPDSSQGKEQTLEEPETGANPSQTKDLNRREYPIPTILLPVVGPIPDMNDEL
ncbi:hypothetical protein BU16DRAFT_583574 [Lophium mytilinum]|uniref:Uncharacterized protein n=1 Tax=Lophium mytilinum TaxID=390894 RepID=A0A6A6QMY3_9PEZI|nr:hypothetical protein BU16DRAFT_583574 [Lophium mytilinum]